MSTLLPNGAALALRVLGVLVYVAVAVIEWRLGSAYHAGLSLLLAGLFLFAGRGERLSVGLALLLCVVLGYGVYRAVGGLALLGLL
ncbi:hypothetical protein [Deinococcus sp.]|uniref:hypothetical protein n=1 Tax=Deinococcus sp. TaxID=47478 RepID=UPI0025F65D39|nr:hypothetical protein [Deinococcus sp.]